MRAREDGGAVNARSGCVNRCIGSLVYALPPFVPFCPPPPATGLCFWNQWREVVVVVGGAVCDDDDGEGIDAAAGVEDDDDDEDDNDDHETW